MLSRLTNAFTPPANPSVLLGLSATSATIHIFHVLPENSTIERFSLTHASSATPIHHHGAVEQTREQIGTVTLYAGEGEGPGNFFDEVETWIHKQQKDSAQRQTGTVQVAQLVQDVLKPAAMNIIHEKATRKRSMNATQDYSVFIIYIRRSKAGNILGEPTSVAS